MIAADASGGSSELAVGVFGVRTFRVSLDGYLLPVVAVSDVWRTGSCIAQCRTGAGHAAPAEGCTCGVYSFRDAAHLTTQYAEARLLVAVVELSGSTLAGPRGYRSQAGRVAALWVAPGALPAFLLEQLRRHLPDVVFHDQLPSMIQAYPGVSVGDRPGTAFDDGAADAAGTPAKGWARRLGRRVPWGLAYRSAVAAVGACVWVGVRVALFGVAAYVHALGGVGAAAGPVDTFLAYAAALMLSWLAVLIGAPGLVFAVTALLACVAGGLGALRGWMAMPRRDLLRSAAVAAIRPVRAAAGWTVAGIGAGWVAGWPVQAPQGAVCIGLYAFAWSGLGSVSRAVGGGALRASVTATAVVGRGSAHRTAKQADGRFWLVEPVAVDR